MNNKIFMSDKEAEREYKEAFDFADALHAEDDRINDEINEKVKQGKKLPVKMINQGELF